MASAQSSLSAEQGARQASEVRVVSEKDYDDIVANLYLAGAGALRWDAALDKVARALRLWAIQIIGVDKRRGSLMFSLEGGPFDPQVAVDYIRDYHLCNPRIEVVQRLRAGTWMHCHEHFSDSFVAADRFHQDFLIPYGGRYMSGTKLIDDHDHVVLLGAHRGIKDTPLNAAEIGLLDRLRNHLIKAVALHNQMEAKEVEFAVGQMILQRLNQPVLLVDSVRNIRYANKAAQAFEVKSRNVSFAGLLLSCRDKEFELLLTSEIRALLDPHRTDATNTRKVLRLPVQGDEFPVLLVLTRLDPDKSLQAFGNIPVVMIAFHETGQSKAIDPALVAEVYGLSPAEAKVAVALAAGSKPIEIAELRGVALSTVKTQMKIAYAKMNIGSQADLLRLLWKLPAI